MALSRLSSLAPALAATCSLLLGAAAVAQDARRELPIVVDAKPVDINLGNNNARFKDIVISQGDVRIEAAEAQVEGGIDFKNSQWTISGNVRITVEGGKLTSDRAVISFIDKVISRATITGTPAEFEQQRPGSALPARGRAQTIDYEINSGDVSLRDGAWLSDGCNEIRGEKLVYNIRAQRVKGQAAPGGNDRVRIVVQPGSESGNPCAKPSTQPQP